MALRGKLRSLLFSADSAWSMMSTVERTKKDKTANLAFSKYDRHSTIKMPIKTKNWKNIDHQNGLKKSSQSSFISKFYLNYNILNYKSKVMWNRLSTMTALQTSAACRVPPTARSQPKADNKVDTYPII